MGVDEPGRDETARRVYEVGSRGSGVGSRGRARLFISSQNVDDPVAVDDNVTAKRGAARAVYDKTAWGKVPLTRPQAR